MTSYNQPPPPGSQPPPQPQVGAPVPTTVPAGAAQQPTPEYWPPGQTPPAQQGGQPQFSAPATQGAPVFHAPSDDATAQALQTAEAEAAQRREGGNFSQNIKFLGPNGETDWTGVPVGYEAYVDVYLCGGWTPEIKVPFVESVSHFFKSNAHPKGKVLKCSDDANDEFCASRKLALAIPQLQASANGFGRKRRQFLYNAFDLTNPQSHYGQDGQMRPFILAAGVTLQSDLKRMFDTRGGIVTFCHPQSGRPIRVTKKKTGPETMNIEYGAIDLEPAPLDPYFHPGLQNLWDLSKEIEPSSSTDVHTALTELGWPIPDTLLAKLGQAQGTPLAYNPNPAPPAASPYLTQETVTAPAQIQPPAESQGVMPPPPPQGYSAPQSAPPGPPPPVGPPPPNGGMVPPPPPPGLPPQGAVPPPPSVTSTGQGVPPPQGPPAGGNPF